MVRHAAQGASGLLAQGAGHASRGGARVVAPVQRRRQRRLCGGSRSPLAAAGALFGLLPLLVAAAALGLLPSAAAQALPPSPGLTASDAALMSAASSHACPVTVRYDVDLGREQNSTQAPIFVGIITISNNYNATIEEWKLGWTFPYNASISSQSDVFGSDLVLENPTSPSPVVHTSPGAGNETLLLEGAMPFPLQFLASKSRDAMASPDNNPFGVAPIENVMFNNLLCSMVAVPSPLAQQAPQPPPLPAAKPKNATEIQVEYTPIEYTGRPLVNTFTQFLIRIRNVQSNQSVDLSSVSLQYWFQGPDVVLPYTQYTPDSFFVVQCAWATTGCDSVGLQISAGFADVPGAHFVVNISMNTSAGLLLPSGENAVPALFLGKGVDVMDLLVTVSTEQGVAILNATQDFSFMDTPQQPYNENDTTIIPRRAIPNPHIPAFIDGELVWGAQPSPGAVTVIDQSPAGMAPAAEQLNLPLGITCESGSTAEQQRCGLSAVYCCSGPDPVSPFIPEEWPPEQSSAAARPGVLPGAVSQASGPPSPSPPPQGAAPSPSPAVPAGAAVPSSDGSSGGGGGSKAWIAGVAAGIAAVVLAAGFVAFRLRRRRRLRQAEDRKAFITDTAMSSVVVVGPQDNGALDCSNDPHSPRRPQGLSALSSALAGMPTKERPLILWPGERHAAGTAAASEAGSVRSSPSKDSHNPLLPPPLFRQQSAGGRSTLFKFGSGLSGVSSAHDNPVFEIEGEGEAGTPAASTPRRLVHWDSNAVDHKSGSVGPSPFKDTQVLGPNGFRGEEGLDAELLAILEKKAATAPTLSTVPLEHGTAWLDRTRGMEVTGGTLELAPWQMRRSKSWDGVVCNTRSLDHLPLLIRRRRSAPQLPGAIPPLAALPPPVLPSAGPLPDVDLDVDYETEIKPYMGQCLGTGGFGAVYEATWQGRPVAVKKLPQLNLDQPFSEQLYEGLLREIQLASKFDCDRLVHVYGACTRDRYNVCLIMELMEGGNLFQRIYDRKKRRMSYLEILQLAHDMAAGLAYLHPSVVHRDLKPQNVLLDKEGRAKLADFGISRVKDPTKSYLSVTNDNGTPMYMAPEQFNGSRVDEKVDVFALGVILNECHTRRQPWRDSNHFFQIILKVAVNGERPWMDPDCPDPLRKLITRCWHQDPHMRPSPAELMRLTDFMIQEELQRWEQLACIQHGAQGGQPHHVSVSRLPSAARGGLGAVGASPRVAAAPADGQAEETLNIAADAAAAAVAAGAEAAAAGPQLGAVAARPTSRRASPEPPVAAAAPGWRGAAGGMEE